MFENYTNASETVSRRNVLKTMGGLIAGSTALAGLGAGRGAAATEEGLQIEVEELTEEYITVSVYVPDELAEEGLGVYLEEPTNVWLGQADQFIIEEGEDGPVVSLPDNPDAVLANPVTMDEKGIAPGGWHLIGYFRLEEIPSLMVDSEEVTLGLGVFPRQTVSGDLWNTDSVRFERVQNNL